MPAVSKAQQAVMALAKHNPDKLYARNKGVLKMSDKQLSDFAGTSTKKLPKHKNALKALMDGDAGTAKKVAAAKKGGCK